ncbi:MAG: hypothetical protein WC350_01220 [Candidatus Micrarchaeia archaeon]|jgi:hypothetical protein
MANLNLVSKSFKEGFGMAKGNWRELFVENAKIVLAALVLSAMAGIIVGLPAALAADALLGSGAGLWAGVALGIFAAVLIYSGMESVSYNVVHEVEGKKRHSLFGNFKRNVLPVAVYTIILLAIIYGIAYGPRFALILSGMDFTQNIALDLALNIYETSISIIIGFLTFFALFELVLNNAGVLQSIGKSYSLVKANLVETLVFYVAYGIYSFVVGLVLGIVFGIIFGVPFLLGAMLLGGISSSALTLVIALAVLLGGAFIVVFLAGTCTAVLPIVYRFWKLAGEK